MAYDVILSSQIEDDIDEAIHYYKKISPELAKEFIQELRFTRDYVHHNPFYFQVRYSNIRIAFMKKFPYGIHYTVIQQSIYLVSLFHTSIDEGKRR